MPSIFVRRVVVVIVEDVDSVKVYTILYVKQDFRRESSFPRTVRRGALDVLGVYVVSADHVVQDRRVFK
jgi:hypothetical protein